MRPILAGPTKSIGREIVRVALADRVDELQRHAYVFKHHAACPHAITGNNGAHDRKRYARIIIDNKLSLD